MASSAQSTVASCAPFSILCQLLDKIANAEKAEKRRRLLSNYISYWRKKHEEMHGKTKTDDSFYPAMRLLLPGFDKERGPYGFKEHMLAKKLADILMMDKNSDDARRLIQYRAPHSAKTATSSGDFTGDFAAVASEVLKHRVSKSEESLMLDEVNRRLDAIALANATRNKAAMDEELEWLCRKVDHVELKWLIRILLKQMKIGMQEGTVLNIFHPEGTQLHDVSTSLKQVCEQLHDPSTRLDVIQVQLFTPFRPMLANRTAPEKVLEIMGQRKFYIEEKYDGERIQLHTNGNEFKYFSRNANDFTSSFGASCKQGSFTPYVCKGFKPSVKNCILDGEMVGWNPEAQCVATKGENFDVKSLRDGDDLHPCFVVFDCVRINDQVLTLKPLKERIEILNEHFVEVEGRFMFAKRSTGSTIKEVIDAMNWAIERREEGIVIKRPDSTYKLNVRSNEGGWLKIKPDYLDAVSDDLDLLIIGGYFGEGRRSNLMSHFLLGLAIPAEKPGEKPKKFISVAKAGTGYTMKELYDLNVHLIKKPLRQGTKVPEWYEVAAERPDVYIDPEFSKVVQIRAAEIIISKQFAAGYTLRFPRVQKIRDDKDWTDAMTVDEFHKLRTESETKSIQKYELKSEEGVSPSKKRRLASRIMSAKPVLGSQFRAADVRKVQKRSDVFKGKEFYVIGGCGEYSKQDLERKVVELGGRTVQNTREETFCVVAEKKIVKVQNIILAGITNVVKPSWLVQCIDRNAYIPWKPSDMLYSTPKVNEEFARQFDEFGDSYTQPIMSEDEMKIILGNAESKLNEDMDIDEANELLMECLPDYEYGIFWRCRAYFDVYCVIGDNGTGMERCPLELTKGVFKLYGGTVMELVDGCTHVVIHERQQKKLVTMSGIDYVKTKRDLILGLRQEQFKDSYSIADATVKFMRKVVAHGKWNTIEDLVTLLRNEGGSLIQAVPNNFVVGNMVKRVLKLVREEDMRLQVGGVEEVAIVDPYESLHKLWDGGAGRRTPTVGHRQLRSSAIENINEFLLELENCNDNIAAQAPDQVADGDSVMTIGHSPNAEAFLRAAAKKHRFKLYVAECAPSCKGQLLADGMKNVSNVEVVLIPEAKIFSCMSQVNKVVIEADAVFANGGLRACAGSYSLCLSAKHFSVPVIVCAAFYKLTPIFLSEDDHERFNVLASPQQLVPFVDGGLLSKVAAYNPLFDYVPPEVVTLFITNVAGNAPSYIYRLLNELYHPGDVDL